MASPRGKKEASRALALGALVRKLRRDQGLTLAQLATDIPMSASNLSRIELGSQGPPGDETIERIATLLDADLDELLRAAGRTAGPFEEVVLDKLEAIRRDLRELMKTVIRERR
jgi:transcriptional regulator with XRE-family HTH domain